MDRGEKAYEGMRGIGGAGVPFGKGRLSTPPCHRRKRMTRLRSD